MRLWNYAGLWHASNWDNPFGALVYKYNHISEQSDGTVNFKLDMFGAPELQGQDGQGYHSSGLWEADVTLPEMRDGLVVAPLWLYNNKTKDEFDFEFIGRRGMEVTIHTYPNGVYRKKSKLLFSDQDWSGRRVRFAIKLSVDNGYAEMFVDGKMVHRFEKQEMGFFTASNMKPIISMWAADPNNSNFTQWLGRWAGIAPGEELVMKVHGYRYTPL